MKVLIREFLKVILCLAGYFDFARFLRAGTTPILEKRSENGGANEILHVGAHQFRESLRELLRELLFSYCSSREVPFREWNFAFRVSVFPFRVLLQEYTGTL